MDDSRHVRCRDLEKAFGLPAVPLDTSIAVVSPPRKRYVVLTDERVRRLLESLTREAGVPQELAPLVTTPPPSKTRVRARIVSLLGDMPEQEILAVWRSLPTLFPKDSTIEFVLDVDAGCISADLLIRMLTGITSLRGPLDSRATASVQICAWARAIPTTRTFLDAIVARKAILRPVLLPTGPALDEPDLKTIAVLADYGLRVPPLLYYTGQDVPQMKGLLRQALAVSLSAGVGLLPLRMSPWEYPSGRLPARRGDLAAVVNAVYRDSYLSEFLLEPIADCEDRLQHAHDSQYVNFLVRPGGLVPFLHVPSTARRAGAVKADSPALLTELSARMLAGHTRCGHCTLQEVCGGVDDGAREAEWQTLCTVRETLLRLFLREAICVAEAIVQPRFQEAAA